MPEKPEEIKPAQPDYKKLSEAVEPREMWRGGGSLPVGEKGVGLRAGKLQSGSEQFIAGEMLLTENQNKRLVQYIKLLNGVINGRVNSEQFQERLEDIFREHESDLSRGGFLSLDARIGIIKNLNRTGELNDEDAERLLALLEEKTVEQDPNVWDATVNVISKKQEEKD